MKVFVVVLNDLYFPYQNPIKISRIQLKILEPVGRILHLNCDDTNAATRTAVADTSDPKWSAPLRQAWPHYLMGASRMWLDLICAFVPIEQEAQAVSGFGELEKRYSEAGDSITSLWQHEGRHAFLHHLNALFGYEPLVIIERRHMRF